MSEEQGRPDLGTVDPKVGTRARKSDSSMRETSKFQRVVNCINLAHPLQCYIVRTYKGGLFHGS